jgi:predicted SAM-dependent methyltransferase
VPLWFGKEIQALPRKTKLTIDGDLSGSASDVKPVRKLHIGGLQRLDGWEILNANSLSAVDHVCDANDLSRFLDGTLEEVYASHVVEHFDYEGALSLALREWWRVLSPGGKIYISVPDLDVLAGLFLRKDFSIEDRFLVMSMIFGGHVDKYDYHLVGFNEAFLSGFLRSAGFIDVQRVSSFGLFDDTSVFSFKDVAISLNVTARKVLPSRTDSLGSVGRNGSCFFMSGKKYKHCHGKLS